MRYMTISMMLFAAFLASGCRGGRSIRLADPKTESIPPGNYPEIDLGADPSKWTWTQTFDRPIEDVVVDPPIDANGPAQLGRDFEGTFDAASIRIRFRMNGGYAIRIVFQDRTVPAETCLVFAGVLKMSPLR